MPFNFFKSLFSRQQSTSAHVPENFREYVQSAIEIWGKQPGALENKKAIQLLIDFGIDKKSARDIFLFLPIAFVHHMLPEVKWPDGYIEYYSNTRQVEKRFIDNPAFVVIREVTSAYFLKGPDSNVVLKIAGRSAEFDAINNMLSKKPNANLSQMSVSPTMVIQ